MVGLRCLNCGGDTAAVNKSGNNNTSDHQRPRDPPHVVRQHRTNHVSNANHVSNSKTASVEVHLATLRSLWNAYDQNKSDYDALLQILKMRIQLGIEVETLSTVADTLSESEKRLYEEAQDELSTSSSRLAAVIEMMEAEVARFESEFLRIQDSFDSNRTELDAETSAIIYSDLQNLKLELSVYSKKWKSVMEPVLVDRLQKVEQFVTGFDKTIKDHLFSEKWDEPASSLAPVSSKTTKRYGIVRSSTLQFKSRQRTENASPFEAETFEQYQKALKKQQSKRASDKNAQPASAASSMRRTSTLRMLAALVTSNEPEQHTAQSRATETHPESHEQQPELQPAASFSSALYKTMNKRQGSVIDVGRFLTVSRVRGDGRCLFRSVARGRAFAMGLRDQWDENMERMEADRLRFRCIEELRQHRELLLTFCVIEGDFEKYCRRMSNPRTFGGEPELLMLALVLHCPIAVYLRKAPSFQQIQVYGRQFTAEPLYILYSDGIHYDCLLQR
mmetsp:Transcript_10330/g.18612  ORF Transcript_10330/g.18612 Transcript_10330/m.18612 type:complete len:504 (-) Transcript_10330:44-1555(-)|eukprot:CAMPEP_0182447882 /NCGR_PEP_ID=MMETSP1172-20130603/21306_1 /TAXON_ID=708627 /ORGANISM="Timspurckia oligopyrenoides, Strain CCMP3278" /LENGTH=503 /DNA_ID=CAMNT_0024644515 /DNA_START=27 /DNA_END=1538 /DNA_ORIENTATION=+